MTTTAENLLLEEMQKLDKTIEEEERALVHLNKQLGNKVTKIKSLNEKRKKLSDAYKDLGKNLMNQPQESVIGLTMTEVK